MPSESRAVLTANQTQVVAAAPRNEEMPLVLPSEGDLVQHGLVATSEVLRRAVTPEVGFLRAIYHEGTRAIEAEREAMLAKKLPLQQIEQKCFQMRYDLAQRVRRTGSKLMKTAAEIFDGTRGNIGRPTLEVLEKRAAEKLLKQLGRPATIEEIQIAIINSASKSNRFVNALPKRLTWVGTGFVLVSVGISVAIVLNASPEQRDQVIEQQANGLAGGLLGGAAGSVLAVAVGIGTGGIGGIVLIFVCSMAGASAAEKFNLVRALGLLPRVIPSFVGALYYVEGLWEPVDLFIASFGGRAVRREEAVLVLATGKVGPAGDALTGHGHDTLVEVMPATPNALSLFGKPDARYVPLSLLREAEPDDFLRAAAQDPN